MAFPANPYLCLTGKTWRHSDVIYGRRIKASKFFFVKMCRIAGWRVLKMLRWSLVTSEDIAEKREGRGQKRALCQSRVKSNIIDLLGVRE